MKSTRRCKAFHKLFAICLLALLTVCLLFLPNIGSAKQYEIVMGSGSERGIFYPMCTIIAKIINENVPGVRATAVVTSGILREYYEQIEQQNWQTGMGFVYEEWKAQNAKPPFEHRYHVKHWFSAVPATVTVLALADANIRYLQDLKGHTIAGQPKGTFAYDLLIAALKYHGVSPDQIKIRVSTPTEAINLLRDGHVKVAAPIAPHPRGQLMEASQARKIRPVEPDPKVADKMFSELAHMTFPFKILKEWYPHMVMDRDYAIQLGAATMCMIDSRLPTDLVYKMTKALFENVEQLHKAHKAYKWIKLENVLLGASKVAVHPGALKYYLERGVPGAENYDPVTGEPLK